MSRYFSVPFGNSLVFIGYGKMSSLAIIEDHPLVAEAVREWVQDIHKFDNIVVLHLAEELLRLNQPDFLIADLNMGGSSVPHLLERFRKRNLATKIVLLTGYPERVSAATLARLEIKSLISKSSPTAVIIEQLRSILVPTPETLFTKLCQAPSQVVMNKECDVFQILSAREVTIYQLLLVDSCLTTIAKQLSISPKTVANHKYQIMKKLDVHTHAELIIQSKTMGY